MAFTLLEFHSEPHASLRRHECDQLYPRLPLNELHQQLHVNCLSCIETDR